MAFYFSRWKQHFFKTCIANFPWLNLKFGTFLNSPLPPILKENERNNLLAIFHLVLNSLLDDSIRSNRMLLEGVETREISDFFVMFEKVIWHGFRTSCKIRNRNWGKKVICMHCSFFVGQKKARGSTLEFDWTDKRRKGRNGQFVRKRKWDEQFKVWLEEMGFDWLLRSLNSVLRSPKCAPFGV